MTVDIREIRVEQALVRAVESAGGDCYKFSSPARRGVPDRLVLLPGGLVCFVECKAPGRKPTELQKATHRRMRELGQRVETIDSLEAATALVGDLARNAR